MKINQVLYIKDKNKLIKRLEALPYLTVEKLFGKVHVVKMKLGGSLINLRKLFERNIIGAIVQNNWDDDYYFASNNVGDNLKQIFKLNDWKKIKEVMNILEEESRNG